MNIEKYRKIAKSLEKDDRFFCDFEEDIIKYLKSQSISLVRYETDSSTESNYLFENIELNQRLAGSLDFTMRQPTLGFYYEIIKSIWEGLPEHICMLLMKLELNEHILAQEYLEMRLEKLRKPSKN